MPEMTPERIDALAQSAKDRDPNPDPLDAPEPTDTYNGSIRWTRGDGVAVSDHVLDVDGYEVSDDALTIFCGSEATVTYAPGSWQRVFMRKSETGRADLREAESPPSHAQRQQSRTLSADDLPIIAKAVKSGNAKATKGNAR